MIQDFGDKDFSNPAFFAGLLVSLFTLCEFVSSWIWAYVSDRIGRIPTLLLGSACGTLSALTFGFSKTIGLALGARIFGGLTNPNVGVIQTCIGELVRTKKHQGLEARSPTALNPSSGPY